MEIAILTDFDGTIINIDTCVFILSNLVGNGWEIYDQQYINGEISLEENMTKQFSLITTPKEDLLDSLEKVVIFRSNFNEFVNFCYIQGIVLEIVSAGLDFVINHFLALKGWSKRIKVVSASTTLTDTGIKLSFPVLQYSSSHNFKDDLVKLYQEKGYLVIYIGDGSTDVSAAEQADVSFAVKGSELAHLLQKRSSYFIEFTDFQEVMNEIQWLIQTHINDVC